MPISIHSIYSQIFKVWRQKRFNLFRSELAPSRTDRLLDVGGFPKFWTSQPAVVGSIDSLNLHSVDWNEASFPEYNIRVLIGDGRNLEMPDKSYDIAFSNSVIEHVGTWENQCVMAREIRRVGDAIWVQTPARECPIEPHYLAPFVHWLPKSTQRKILRHFTPWGLISKPSREKVDMMVDTTRLMTLGEVRSLFPDCEIRVERLLGILPKSYIAIRQKERRKSGG